MSNNKINIYLETPEYLKNYFVSYYIFRELSNQGLANFNKEETTENIFKAAKKILGDSLIYAERAAASFFFHILINKQSKKARVFEIHLTKENYKENAFTRLTWCGWANSVSGDE